MIKDALHDICKAISVLEFDIVKITGTDGDLVLQSMTNGKSCGQVFFSGKIKKKIKEFDGVFGVSDITMLSGLMGVEAFNAASAKISMKYLDKNGIKVPEELVFENKDFGKASYRLTAEAAIPKQMVQKSEMPWDITITQPVLSKINDFAKMASIYSSQESKFSIKTENNSLVFMIGEEGAATSKAQVVFAENIIGNLKSTHSWFIGGVLSVLRLGSNSNIVLKVNSHGFLQIEVETGLGEFKYLFGGQKI